MTGSPVTQNPPPKTERVLRRSVTEKSQTAVWLFRFGGLSVRSARRVRTLEYIAIDLNELLQIRGHVFLRENRRHRTLRLARTAVDALVRVNVELLGPLVDAVHGADIDARSILRVLAGFSDYVGHLLARISDETYAKNRPGGSNINSVALTSAWRFPRPASDR